LKIVIISPAYPFRGGIAASSERLAEEFIRLGHKVEIHTFTKQYPKFLFPGKTQLSEGKAPSNLNIKRTIHAYNPLNWISAGLKLRKTRADLIITRYWLPFMAPALGTVNLIGKRKRIAIGLVDNIIPHEPHFYDSILSAYFVRQMNAFIVMSRSVKDELRQFTKSKSIDYHPHPIYDIYGIKPEKKVALKKLNLDPSFKYLLFFGFIRDYKGLDLLLKAMDQNRLKTQNLKLIVAGEFYGNQEKYETLIDQLNLREKVILKSDFIADEAVKYYFSAADLLVQPYKSATQSGIAQIAYHFELPMIVTNVGGLPEIVIDGESGYVVEPDPTEIAKAIDRFFDQNKAEEFTAGTRELKMRYSWERLANGFLTISKA
jgi:glycosyltransferase involved in cell wall biosynthesis